MDHHRRRHGPGHGSSLPQPDRRHLRCAPPLERGRILGTYRYWRDTGYAIGGLVLGLVAQWSDEILPAIWLTAGIVALSGLWIALAVRETHPRSI